MVNQMTRYAFLIDQTKCIGCHACTVACKMENNVPLGVFRTWVKYIERGEFPQVRRFYTVLRCNHCDEAPCVEICPTSALYKRLDGIVDFDNSRCIGCKACMQACPYDALYIDPENGTAAKCHFCAHRIDVGLEPACVIVCPTQAIMWGDLDDPNSSVSKTLRNNPSVVRKPEQKTKPKLFYVGADHAAITPLAGKREEMYIWAENAEKEDWARENLTPIQTKVVYDVKHQRPWGIKISTYLWTKSVSAGIMLMLALLTLTIPGFMSAILSGIHNLLFSAFAFLTLTGYFLVADLKRPDRFIYVFLKPNFSSWLVKGAFLVSFFGLVIILWFIVPDNIILQLITIPISVLTSGYSAYLFSQAEGRDFWQSPSTFIHLIFAATQAGSAFLLLISSLLTVIFPENTKNLLFISLILSNVVLALVAISDVFQKHVTAESELAAKYIGSFSAFYFWVVFVVIGIVLSSSFGIIYLIDTNLNISSFLAAATALIGLYTYEYLWVKAGQIPPLS